jgi:hypothetical protein
MEHQLWKAIVALLAEFGKPRFDPREDFTDHDIVRVWYWAVVHDRPTSWALCPGHWAPHLRRGLRLPSGGTMSKRLRRPPVVALLAQLERRVIAPKEAGVYWMIDGKPLPIGGCSQDRQAGYGRAAGGKAKGYKLHALVNPRGEVAGWRVAPMNTDERVMAARLLQAAPAEVQGYVVTDSNYDSNPLHAACEARPGGCSWSTAAATGRATATATARRPPGGCGVRSCWRTRSRRSATSCWRTGPRSSATSAGWSTGAGG